MNPHLVSNDQSPNTTPTANKMKKIVEKQKQIPARPNSYMHFKNKVLKSQKKPNILIEGSSEPINIDFNMESDRPKFIRKKRSSESTGLSNRSANPTPRSEKNEITFQPTSNDKAKSNTEVFKNLLQKSQDLQNEIVTCLENQKYEI